MGLFNRSLQLKRRTRFNDGSDPFHAELADLIQDRLKYVLRSFDRILIIGDLNLSFPSASAVIHLPKDLVATSDFLPFGESAFDLIISYMDLHHANDIPGVLKQINYALKPDGLFLGCFLGGDSLWQLRLAAQEAELLIRKGCSPRVAPMVSLHDAAALLQRAEFSIPVLDHEKLTLCASTGYDLLKRLQALGLSNSLNDGYKGLTGKAFIRELCRIIEDDYANSLELDVLLLSGWAPAPNQQKALPRGSGQVFLGDALGSVPPPQGER